jgi:hypothetical protein
MSLAFNLDFYTQVQDLKYLLDWINSDPFGSKFVKLNEALVDLIEGFGIVGFYTLFVEVIDYCLPPLVTS